MRLAWPGQAREFRRDLANGDVEIKAPWANWFWLVPGSVPSLDRVDCAIQSAAEEWLQDSEFAGGPMPDFFYLSERWFQIEPLVIERLLEDLHDH